MLSCLVKWSHAKKSSNSLVKLILSYVTDNPYYFQLYTVTYQDFLPQLFSNQYPKYFDSFNISKGYFLIKPVLVFCSHFDIH